MNHIRPAAFFVLAAMAFGSCGGPSGGCGARVPAGPLEHRLGGQAPNFVLENLSGEKVELAPLVREGPALLVFWATWCPTCTEEIPVLNAWTEDYPGLRILGINYQESEAELKSFASQKGVLYSILLDREGEVARQYGLVGIPAVVLVAKGGRVVYYGFALPQNIGELIAP